MADSWLPVVRVERIMARPRAASAGASVGREGPVSGSPPAGLAPLRARRRSSSPFQWPPPWWIFALFWATSVFLTGVVGIRVYHQWVVFQWSRGWTDAVEEILGCVESRADTSLGSCCRDHLQLPSRGDRRELFLWLTKCDPYWDYGDQSSWLQIFRLAGRLLAPHQYSSLEL